MLPGERLETLWLGVEGGIEANLVKRLGIPFQAIPAAGLHGVGLRAIPGNLLRLVRGYLAARQILKRFKPDVLFFTGGYVAVPVAYAGLRLPKVLFVPDIQPAAALQVLAWVSQKIAITVEDSAAYYPKSSQKRLVVTGYPIREEVKTWTRQSALEHLGLTPNLPVLLVTGGSKGARSINRALVSGLPELLQKVQVLHLTGTNDWAEVEQQRQQLKERGVTNLERYIPMPYLHEMGAALAAADLVLSRAGASTLGEYPYFGLPAVLVPYPYAWKYQQVNARWLEQRGAAVILPDGELPARLTHQVLELLQDTSRLERMRKAASQLATPTADQAIAELLLQQAAARKGISP